MIKIKLNAQKENELSMQVLEQDNREMKEFWYENFYIDIYIESQLANVGIFLRGYITNKNNSVKKFDNNDEKSEYIKKLVECVKAYERERGEKFIIEWVKPRKRAEFGGKYYFVGINGKGIIISTYSECNDEVDDRLYKNGNYFLNKEDAEKYRDY